MRSRCAWCQLHDGMLRSGAAQGENGHSLTAASMGPPWKRMRTRISRGYC